jgi:hypothetical protein
VNLFFLRPLNFIETNQKVINNIKRTRNNITCLQNVWYPNFGTKLIKKDYAILSKVSTFYVSQFNQIIVFFYLCNCALIINILLYGMPMN